MLNIKRRRHIHFCTCQEWIYVLTIYNPMMYISRGAESSREFCVVSSERRHSGSLDSSLIRWSTMPTFRWNHVGHMIGRYAHIEQIAILKVQFVWYIVLIETQKRLSKHRKLSSGNSEFRLRRDRTAGLKQTHDGIDTPTPPPPTPPHPHPHPPTPHPAHTPTPLLICNGVLYCRLIIGNVH